MPSHSQSSRVDLWPPQLMQVLCELPCGYVRSHPSPHSASSQYHIQVHSLPQATAFFLFFPFRQAWAVNLSLLCNIAQSCTFHSVGIPSHLLPFLQDWGVPPFSGDPCSVPHYTIFNFLFLLIYIFDFMSS